MFKHGARIYAYAELDVVFVAVELVSVSRTELL